MKQGFRHSMNWLHTWSGLLLGWLLFAIFLTGTIAYFRQEVTFWMQPELHRSVPDDQTAERAVARMAELAPNATTWSITLPSERSAAVSVTWREPTAQGAAPENIRAGIKRAVLDAGTGETLTPRETAGGNFLYRFHFELYGLPHETARWIVAIATMAMLVAIVTGIIIHRRIFKDFFTFRPGKSPVRAWMDGHIVTGVLALPYHLMITYSGLLLFMTMLMPWAIDFAYDGNRQTYMAESGLRRGTPAPRPARETAPLTPIMPLFAAGQEEWRDRGGVGSITVTNPGRANATIELRPAESDGVRRGSSDRLLFDGVSGERLDTPAAPPQPGAMATGSVLMGLHLARFAEPGMRWLFFISGVGGTAMIGTGLILWVVKRRVKQAQTDEPTPFGHRLADWLNTGAVAGLLAAVAAYFWANRLLPAGMSGRADWEIGVFFTVWAAAFLHPPLRPPHRAWAEQLWTAAALFAALPVLNALTAPASHLGRTLPAGHWLLAGTDLVMLATGLLLAFAAWKAGRATRPQPHEDEAPEQPGAAAARPVSGSTAVPAGAVMEKAS